MTAFAQNATFLAFFFKNQGMSEKLKEGCQNLRYFGKTQEIFQKIARNFRIFRKLCKVAAMPLGGNLPSCVVRLLFP